MLLKLMEVMRANSSLYVSGNLIDKAEEKKHIYILNFRGQT